MTTTQAACFVHPALFYRSDDEYLAGLVPFITDGLRDGDPVAVAVPGDRVALLGGELGDLVHQVRMLDMTEAGRNPGAIIAHVLRAFADAHPASHVRIVGEPIWRERNAAEYPACVQHEALINAAFAERNVTIVCPYDAARLTPAMLSDAETTHPVLWNSGEARSSVRYAPESAIDRYNLPLNESPRAAKFTTDSPSDLSAVREFVAAEGRANHLTPEQIGDLELIACELVTNSLVHAGSPATVTIWPEHEYVVCQVFDSGRFSDPLAGRRPAEPGQLGGRGLLLVHAFADLVRTHTGDTGTTIRVYLRRRTP